MAEQKMTLEAATSEINDWLDFKGISSRNRERLADVIETLTDAIQSGFAWINPDKSITQKLRFPITDENGNPIVQELTYKARITLGELKKRTANIRPGDTDGRFSAYAAALTSSPAAYFDKLDTADGGVMNAVVVFFI